MKRLISTSLRAFFQVLILVSALGMCFFIYADTTIELEFGYEALEEYKTYQLDPDLEYIGYDEGIITIDVNGLVTAKRFGDTYITVMKDGEVIDTIEVIVYLVGDEPVPWGSVSISRSYISGYPDGQFKPKNFLTRAEAATMFAKILALQPIDEIAFLDLTEEHWGYEFIQSMVTHKLMTPRTVDEFFPDAFLTRGEFAELIVRYADFQSIEMDPEPKQMVMDITFKDANFLTIHKVMNARLFELENFQFQPEAFIMRAEAVSIINQIIDRKGNSLKVNRFEDIDIEDIYYYDVLNAYYDYP